MSLSKPRSEVSSQQEFKIVIEGAHGAMPNIFNKWREAFAFGKKIGLPFTVVMRGFIIAGWGPKEGFYHFVAPEFLLMAETIQKRRQARSGKPSQPTL